MNEQGRLENTPDGYSGQGPRSLARPEGIGGRSVETIVHWACQTRIGNFQRKKTLEHIHSKGTGHGFVGISSGVGSQFGTRASQGAFRVPYVPLITEAEGKGGVS